MVVGQVHPDPNVLPVRAVEPDGTIGRSHRMLGRGGSSANLIALMDELPWSGIRNSPRRGGNRGCGDDTIYFGVSQAAPGCTEHPCRRSLSRGG